MERISIFDMLKAGKLMPKFRLIKLLPMWETAKDMNSKYKETSEGGLAVSINISDS